MAKLVALAAYLYQAVLAFGLLIVLSHLLPPGEYAAYSLFASIAQFGAIAFFEWVRFACSRFYPGPDGASEASERGTITAEFVASAVACVVAGLFATIWGAPLWVGLAGAGAAVLIAAGELHLTMLRFRLAFGLFSRLQGVRASLLAAATVGGAFISADFAHVVLGILFGNVLYCLIAFAAARQVLGWSVRADLGAVRRHLAYGGVSAGASVAGLLGPLGLKAILVAAFGATPAAGALLALDLLQRPFILIVSSLQAIRYPDLVALYDRSGAGDALKQELGRYYALLACLTLIGGALLLAVMEWAAGFVVPRDLQGAFLRTAPAFTVMALIRALVQTLLPTPAHLLRRLRAIAGLAALDCVLMCAGAFIAMGLLPGSDTAIALGAAAGAGLAMLAGLPLLRLLPFAMPWRPVALAGAALLAALLIKIGLSGNVLLSTAVALAAVLSLGAAPALAAFRWAAR
ncbi:Oligosaccharide flippase family protein [Hyphomicrobiales bacterium]|nr:Oligosaccharide flippase family protein [Hyphomicrobiales bacterium]CAH1701707.1 Oligosaccharide flippase family protein [Hyphomicrobiales bacterium]CAI0345863.1 Oligosaccharide flippase family protein [Hyphomicrobiales bacterium]